MAAKTHRWVTVFFPAHPLCKRWSKNPSLISLLGRLLHECSATRRAKLNGGHVEAVRPRENHVECRIWLQWLKGEGHLPGAHGTTSGNPARQCAQASQAPGTVGRWMRAACSATRATILMNLPLKHVWAIRNTLHLSRQIRDPWYLT